MRKLIARMGINCWKSQQRSWHICQRLKVNHYAGNLGDNNGDRWLVALWEHGRTTSGRFYFFIEKITYDIGPEINQQRLCLTMENLVRDHKIPLN